MATARGFPGISVENGRKERGANVANWWCCFIVPRGNIYMMDDVIGIITIKRFLNDYLLMHGQICHRHITD